MIGFIWNLVKLAVVGLVLFFAYVWFMEVPLEGAAIEFVSVDARELPRSGNWGEMSMKVEVKNTGTCDAFVLFTVSALDAEGFSLGTYPMSAGVPVGETVTVTGRGYFDHINLIDEMRATADSSPYCARL